MNPEVRRAVEAAANAYWDAEADPKVDMTSSNQARIAIITFLKALPVATVAATIEAASLLDWEVATPSDVWSVMVAVLLKELER